MTTALVKAKELGIRAFLAGKIREPRLDEAMSLFWSYTPINKTDGMIEAWEAGYDHASSLLTLKRKH